MEDCDLSEALRLLVRERGAQMLLVTDGAGALAGNRDKDRYTARSEDVVRSAAAIQTSAPLAPPALPVVLNR